MQIVTYATRRLVKRHRGTMPIILTCPHGGSERPARVSERDRALTPATCTGANDFNAGGDRMTLEMTEAVARRILNDTGLSPYVVLARFDRKYIDANRRRDCAFTDPDAGPFYDEYHNRIRGYVDQILAQNGGRGFLFDIHGTPVQSADPADIFLGTRNGATLQPGFDRASLFMQHGLQGLLTWSRFPRLGTADGRPAFTFDVSPRRAGDREFGALNGGFTIRDQNARINAIQIELTRPLRTEALKFEATAEALANAMIHFVRRHAPF